MQPNQQNQQNQPNQQNILFIGGGNMATALIGGILANQKQQNIKISVLEISQIAAKSLQKKFPEITIFSFADEISNANNFDTIFLAVKPQNLADALQPLQKLNFWQTALIISIVAGMTTQKIQTFLNATNLKIVRVMPNTPALINQAMSGLFANANVDETNKNLAQNLLSSVGKILWLNDENQIDAITAISGSGPAYVFLFLEALQKAAQNMGFDNKQAELLAIQTMLGAALLAKNNIDSGKDNFAQLRQKVTSKGGTTAAALDVFFKNNFENLVEKACQAAQQRSVELGK